MKASELIDLIKKFEKDDDVCFYASIDGGDARLMVASGGEAVTVADTKNAIFVDVPHSNTRLYTIPSSENGEFVWMVKVYDNEHDRLSWMPVPSHDPVYV